VAGLNAQELQGRLFIARVAPEGPAERAGLRPGDLLIAVDGEAVGSLAEFYRKVWARGAAGAELNLRVLQGQEMKDVRVRSIDRLEHLRRTPTY
jgi:serine protease Do